ncbi:MAG: sugar-binding transcriptional regulator [Oscillospiraceae bacterium]
MTYKESLITKIAWYYYVQGLTQQNIATILGISRLKVIKLLEEARESGVVEFKLHRGSESRVAVERGLCEAFGLSDAFVVPTDSNPLERNESIAKAAAMYISDCFPECNVINIGYGDSASRVLNNLAESSDKAISFVSLTGGVNYYLPNKVRKIFNASLSLMPAPLYTSSAELSEALRNEPAVADVARMSSLSDLTVVGIGGMNNDATIVSSGVLSMNDFNYLRMKGAVGDILSHFLDADGNIVSEDFECRLISTPLDWLVRCKNVICVAAGEEKVAAIRAAMKKSYINILVTDEATANCLISTK